MSRDIQRIIDRQYAIATNEGPTLDLPKYKKYTMGNLRGGIGKTTLSFNLSYLGDNVLSVDTCPQGNLSYFLIMHIFKILLSQLEI